MSTFSETQKALRVWLLIILAVSWCGFMLFSFVALKQQLVDGIPFGDKPMPDNILIVFVILINVVFMFLEAMVILLKLDVSIDKYGITYSYFPFVGKRTIAKDEIKFAFVRNYRAIKEYGGWGYRKMRKSKALNVWGKWGIQIVTKKDKYLLLGTQKPEEARAVLESLGYEKFSVKN